MQLFVIDDFSSFFGVFMLEAADRALRERHTVHIGRRRSRQ
jgi:hypothetical protein